MTYDILFYSNPVCNKDINEIICSASDLSEVVADIVNDGSLIISIKLERR